ncbi:hypothetical protein [Burkholderia sp. Cy-637]|uniref:hypothetical protein n=1 Tax=Burkholderia sp. Cy-637 TaxID=2608327 RepID=UPI0014226754|nr:hypothetical protein [Burkholderia sp. Cy-637]NIF88874.1 hypothetical protein [Burkholderia sp. Cy-637]
MNSLHTIPADSLAFLKSAETFPAGLYLRNIADDAAADVRHGSHDVTSIDAAGVYFSANGVFVDVIVDQASSDAANLRAIRAGHVDDQRRIIKGESVEMGVSYPNAARTLFLRGTIISKPRTVDGKTIFRFHFDSHEKDAVMAA